MEGIYPPPRTGKGHAGGPARRTPPAPASQGGPVDVGCSSRDARREGDPRRGGHARSGRGWATRASKGGAAGGGLGRGGKRPLQAPRCGGDRPRRELERGLRSGRRCTRPRSALGAAAGETLGPRGPSALFGPRRAPRPVPAGPSPAGGAGGRAGGGRAPSPLAPSLKSSVLCRAAAIVRRGPVPCLGEAAAGDWGAARRVGLRPAGSEPRRGGRG